MEPPEETGRGSEMPARAASEMDAAAGLVGTRLKVAYRFSAG
jgi:hypothetical protein